MHILIYKYQLMNLIFATHNNNKLKEVKSLLNKNVNLLSLEDIKFNKEIDETEFTLEGNALLKAKTIYQHTGINCFADDSGLLVDSLNGEPGVFSARYAGNQKNDQDNLQKLLFNLKGISKRDAHFKTVIALIIDGKEFLFEGIINGIITLEPSGNNGFGYDPIFIPNGYTETFAEMASEIKHQISHRGLALKKMINFLTTI